MARRCWGWCESNLHRMNHPAFCGLSPAFGAMPSAIAPYDFRGTVRKKLNARIRSGVERKSPCEPPSSAAAPGGGRRGLSESSRGYREGEFRSRPTWRAAQGSPKGRRTGGRLLLVTFLGGSRKVTSRRAAPGELGVDVQHTSHATFTYGAIGIAPYRPCTNALRFDCTLHITSYVSYVSASSRDSCAAFATESLLPRNANTMNQMPAIRNAIPTQNVKCVAALIRIPPAATDAIPLSRK